MSGVKETDMADLSDEELAEYLRDCGHMMRHATVADRAIRMAHELRSCRRAIAADGEEITRHRATMKRLEEWAERLDLENRTHTTATRTIAAELRKRMEGD